MAEDREWPGLFDRKAAESAEAQREGEALEQAERDELAKVGSTIAEHARELAEQRAREDEEQRQAAEAQEAAAAKEREAARKALLKQREQLTATRDKLVK